MGPSSEEVAAELGVRLGGTVHDLHRLSGGASRLTSSFDLEVPATSGSRRPLIVQMDRAEGSRGSRVGVDRALLVAARAAGVPVPEVVAAGGGEGDPLGAGWLVVERLEGETIARRILRDNEWAEARERLVPQCAAALAAIHRIDPQTIDGLPPEDPFADPLPWLDTARVVRPMLELGARWLASHRPARGRSVTVHGDFRLGNLLVGPDGLRGVLDWELAHLGDAAEDIGWLCAPAWRFGGAGEVGGLGSLEELVGAYEAAGGEAMARERVHWWQVYATVKWATICVLQAASHLSGATRSVELATIGRRECESEWDLCTLLGLEPTGPAPEGVGREHAVAPFGRPTAAELVEAVREYLEDSVMGRTEGSAHFEARVARNALGIVERELLLGPDVAAAHESRLRDLGVHDDATLAAALRAGEFDDDLERVAGVLAASARDQLLVANPTYLPEGAA